MKKIEEKNFEYFLNTAEYEKRGVSHWLSLFTLAGIGLFTLFDGVSQLALYIGIALWIFMSIVLLVILCFPKSAERKDLLDGLSGLEASLMVLLCGVAVAYSEEFFPYAIVGYVCIWGIGSAVFCWTILKNIHENLYEPKETLHQYLKGEQVFCVITKRFIIFIVATILLSVAQLLCSFAIPDIFTNNTLSPIGTQLCSCAFLLLSVVQFFGWRMILKFVLQMRFIKEYQRKQNDDV